MGPKAIISVVGTAIKESSLSMQRDIEALDLVALSFKVPFEFRQAFKLQALRRGITMTELLTHAFETYVDATPIGTSPNTGFRK